jgi:hypothetical protein
MGSSGGGLGIWLVWFCGIDWMYRISLAHFEGNTVTLHNIRNFDYRSEFDYQPAYYDKSYDLNKLEGADLFTFYWMGPAIAHTILSFNFGEQGYLAVREKPQFYNTLLDNCTTAVWVRSLVNAEHVPFSWKILLSGYLPEYLYESKRLEQQVPFAELQRQAHINRLAQAADQSPDFSERIRAVNEPNRRSGRDCRNPEAKDGAGLSHPCALDAK